jgi:hypothetical protein
MTAKKDVSRKECMPGGGARGKVSTLMKMRICRNNIEVYKEDVNRNKLAHDGIQWRTLVLQS